MKISDQFKVKFSAAILCFGLLVLICYSVLRHSGHEESAKNYVSYNEGVPETKTGTAIIAAAATTTTLMSSDYNETIANHSLTLSLITYCDETLVESWSCPYCGSVKNFEVYKYVEAGFLGDSLVAIIGYDSTYHQIVVAFRGSNNLANWVANLEFWQMDYPGVSGGRVHSGFYRSWKELEEEVTEGYKQVLADYPKSQVLFTGHSLGGALAALSYLDLRDISSDDSSVYPQAFYLHSFGKPRWGNPIMADYFSESIDFHWRVVFVHDIVPQVPPPFLDYQHSGDEIWYWCGSPMSYYECDSSSGEDSRCSYIGGSVYDHLHYLNTEFLCGAPLPDRIALPFACVPDPNK